MPAIKDQVVMPALKDQVEILALKDHDRFPMVSNSPMVVLTCSLLLDDFPLITLELFNF